jgi:hypothetical protein
VAPSRGEIDMQIRKQMFSNGYGVSVVDHGYGSEKGLLEVAVLDSEGELCYSTPITSNVIGWQTPEQVLKIVEAIKALPAK